MKKYLSFFRLRFVNGIQYRAAALAGIVTQFAWGFFGDSCISGISPINYCVVTSRTLWFGHPKGSSHIDLVLFYVANGILYCSSILYADLYFNFFYYFFSRDKNGIHHHG